MSKPLVSILTPVYNGEKFLDRAVESVIFQTYPRWELFLIDDGSCDASYQRCLGWAGKDQRIKALCHEGGKNRGVSATRNLGIANARGEYIALLDCDDEWLPEKLERQVNAIRESAEGPTVVYSKAVSIDQDGIELSKSSYSYDFPAVFGTRLPFDVSAIVSGMIADTVWMPALTVLLRAEVVRNLGGFDETLKFQVEDHLLFTLAAAAGKVCFVDEILARYRVHPDSYTQTARWKYAMLEYFDRLDLKLPPSYRKEINVARTRLIAYELITASSFTSRTAFAEAWKMIYAQVARADTSLGEKAAFLSLFVTRAGRKLLRC